MALLDRLKQELDRAGKAAQDAFDDGKTRLEAFRTRQLADKAAQSLGYAVYRARKSGSELDAATYDRLRATRPDSRLKSSCGASKERRRAARRAPGLAPAPTARQITQARRVKAATLI